VVVLIAGASYLDGTEKEKSGKKKCENVNAQQKLRSSNKSQQKLYKHTRDLQLGELRAPRHQADKSCNASFVSVGRCEKMRSRKVKGGYPCGAAKKHTTHVSQPDLNKMY
jgi:hypothetical protein